jgi:uncharacterized protein YciI
VPTNERVREPTSRAGGGIVLYVVTLEFIEEPSDVLRQDHRKALGRLSEEGHLLLSGPFPGTKIGMAILRAMSIERARSIYEVTPLAVAGIIKWEIREWDARAGVLSSHVI